MPLDWTFLSFFAFLYSYCTKKQNLKKVARQFVLHSVCRQAKWSSKSGRRVIIFCLSAHLLKKDVEYFNFLQFSGSQVSTRGPQPKHWLEKKLGGPRVHGVYANFQGTFIKFHCFTAIGGNYWRSSSTTLFGLSVPREKRVKLFNFPSLKI